MAKMIGAFLGWIILGMLLMTAGALAFMVTTDPLLASDLTFTQALGLSASLMVGSAILK